MASLLKGAFFSAIHVAAIWFGLIDKHDGALNIALAMTWFVNIVGLFLLSDAAINELSKRRIGPVRTFADRAIDVGIAGTFIYYGWFVTGGMYLLHIVVAMSARAEANKIHAKRELERMAQA